jgi:hypothetical protein
MPDIVKSWQVPPREAPGTYIKGYCDELCQNGERWLESQRGIEHIQEDIKLIMGYGQDLNLPTNILQTKIRSFVETISDLRQIATLGSKAPQFKKPIAAYNGALKYIFWDSDFLFRSRQALQWGMVGRGYLWTRFSRDKYGWGRARNTFEALGPMDFLPEQLPANNDIQGAYAGTVLFPMPVAEAHARFPEFQDYLTPMSRYDWKRYGTNAYGPRLDFWDRWKFEEDRYWETKYCLIRYHWFRDLRLNETGSTIQMGVEGSTWGYKVPSLGSLIVSTNPFNGLPESRLASPEDCLLYPQLRQIITCPTVPVPMYDDTAFDWHGEIPVVSYDVNDWVWQAIGQSSVRNVAGIERARRARLDEINDVLAVRKDPPTGYDVSAGVGRTQLEKLDLLRSQGIRVGVKGDPKTKIVSVLPESIQVDGEDWAAQKAYNDLIDETLGTTDISSLRELNMNISDQSLEKIIKNLGPMAQGIAVNMWRAHARIAKMLKYNIAQYISVDELINMIGPEGVAIDTYDNDPYTLVPSHLPGESLDNDSHYSKQDRAKWFCEKVGIVSTPAQLLNTTQMQERMMYMFLMQQHAPISQETTFEKLGVQGYDTEREKYRAEQLDDAEWKLEVQATLQQKAAELHLQPAEPPNQQGQGGGRPATFQKPQHLEQKGSQDGRVRVVNSTS